MPKVLLRMPKSRFFALAAARKNAMSTFGSVLSAKLHRRDVRYKPGEL